MNKKLNNAYKTIGEVAELLNPKNEEALILLIDMELNRSNFSKVKELRNKFNKVCLNLCEKISSVNTRLKEFEKKDAS